MAGFPTGMLHIDLKRYYLVGEGFVKRTLTLGRLLKKMAENFNKGGTMPEIVIGKINFPALPKNHPLRKLCEEENFDARLREKVCKYWMESLRHFIDGLSTQRTEEDFTEVANARESSFRGSMLTDDGEALLLATDATEPVEEDGSTLFTDPDEREML